MAKLYDGKPIETAIKVALRAASCGLPSPKELEREFGISRATSYRLYRRVHDAMAAAASTA